MTNKTIDGVPRELLERIAQWGSVSWPDKNELRALLAAPVVERQGEAVEMYPRCTILKECNVKSSAASGARVNAIAKPITRRVCHACVGSPRDTFCPICDDGQPVPDGPLTDEGTMPERMTYARAGELSDYPMTYMNAYDAGLEAGLIARLDVGAVVADHKRLVRELDVLLNGEAGAADQASLCDIVAQVRMARKKPGTGALQLLALVPDQVVGRVHHNPDHHDQVRAVLNECGRALPDNAPLYARPADTVMRYVRAPSRKDPKYHEEWPEIEGGPVFDGVTYCNDLFEALKRFNVIVAETMPENSVDG